jgi:hypothetical protein
VLTVGVAGPPRRATDRVCRRRLHCGLLTIRYVSIL